MAQKQVAPKNVGVINPYALAEVLRKESIEWQEVDTHEVLADTFDMSYEELFDPKFDSPLYAGLELNPETLEMERAELPMMAADLVEEPSLPVTDADARVTDDDSEPGGIGVAEALAGVSVTASWQDPGIFFKEAAEMTDPVQGALGDCYLIAALSSVAWARTYDIAHRSRATGTAQEQFMDLIVFHHQKKPIRIEVSERVPLNPPANTFIYARSSEPGEIWPAVYEKAYAKWRTGHSGDTPNYAPIAGGDPVGAAAQLTGLQPHYYWTVSHSADTIWQKVRQNSLSRKTFNPMVAWTYSSGEKSPDKVNYNNAHIAANHAYSILGWDYVGGQKYIVLRNPWGTYEAQVGIIGGKWYAWDAPYYGGPGWWRPIDMATVDGIFALNAGTFKKYFAGFGWVD